MQFCRDSCERERTQVEDMELSKWGGGLARSEGQGRLWPRAKKSGSVARRYKRKLYLRGGGGRTGKAGAT